MRYRGRANDDSAMRPLIGVTTSEMRPSSLATTRRHGEPPHPEMALGMTYLRTLDAAGAIPVVLPPVGTDHLSPLLDRLDGICLSGGPDLDPAAYGATDRHAQLGPTEPSLDAFELSPLARGAHAQHPDPGHLPRLAGAQRRLRRHAAPARRRPPPDRRGDGAHARGRGRGGLAPAPHHALTPARRQLLPPPGRGQARRRPEGRRPRRRRHGRGIEGPGSFTLGVQWHAETLYAHLALFEALVRAAARTELRIAA